MNQKAVNFSKKYRRSRIAESSENSIRRPTLFSVKDSEQLAMESSRARLIQQLTKSDKALPRDFAAYFHGPTKNSDPAYGVTSHHTREPLPRRRVVIPTFPCTQSLRWNPYVETSSIEEEPDTPDLRSNMRQDLRPYQKPDPDLRPEDPKFNCRCETCARQKCPSRTPSSSAIRPVFRDNIMTFCNKYTMTPRLNEVGCGCTPAPSTRVSDMSVTASDIAVKDTQASMQIHRLYSPEQCPASILKNNGENYEDYPSYSQSHCCEHAYQPAINYRQEPERDMEEEPIAPSKISSIKSFFKCKKKKDCANPRRMIYNEGISDLVANNFPVTPVRVPSPTNLKKECSKASVKSRCCLIEGIPFSHRSDSRYHHNCKKSNSRSFYGDSDDVRHLITSPDIIRKTYASKPVKCHKIPNIRMPKRVLMSERDIESYIDRGFPKFMVPASRRPRGN